MNYDLTSHAERAHQNARDHGFYDNPRDFEEMMALADSELIEAMEEHRVGSPLEYGLHATDCPNRIDPEVAAAPFAEPCGCKPEGIATELADFVIRCLDTIYGLGDHRGPRYFDLTMALRINDHGLSDNFAASVFRISKHLHDAARAHAIQGWRSASYHLGNAIVKTVALAEMVGCDDFVGVIERKMEYNSKREFRHGKNY